MPELNLMQTICLAGLLLLSLVLPLMLSAGGNHGEKAAFRIVLGGQLIGALAGLSIVFFPAGFLFATGFAVVNCFFCGRALRKLRSAN